MKKLNLIIPLLTFLFTLTLVKSKAQRYEVVQGVNLSFFTTAKKPFTDFVADPALGYDIGIDFWFYPHRLFPIVLSAHIFHQKGTVFYKSGNDLFFTHETFIYDTRYFVLGIQPYTFKNKYNGLEIAVGLEAAIIQRNNSARYSRSVTTTSTGTSSYFNRGRYGLNQYPTYFGKLNIGYAIELGNKCKFIPRLVFRIAHLKSEDVVGSEKNIGLELGFRF